MAQEFACTDGIRFLHVDVKDCKLFTYFRNKVRRETLRGPTLSAAPDNITLVSRLATGFGKDAAGAWLREIRRRPYVGQLNFFRLVFITRCNKKNEYYKCDFFKNIFRHVFSFNNKIMLNPLLGLQLLFPIKTKK